ncbi:hypothetical protein IW492_13505 [Enterococcus sp. BWB1-3]|uniref:hypothetical protein n=1 Tax=Enterococcus sp. BWB1-3 TaxID=2787713 RepID=UPI001921D8C3|nr:hypothetical protein [Enterococcus sp. BWB1-3]MBL1230247.1 hypothetical protein [Enterococcus sp. BWB1-3]
MNSKDGRIPSILRKIRIIWTIGDLHGQLQLFLQGFINPVGAESRSANFLYLIVINFYPASLV